MIEVGDRVFYYEGCRTKIGFGLVIELVEKSEKFKFIKQINAKLHSNSKVFLILKDNGLLEEFVEFDLKKVVEF